MAAWMRRIPVLAHESDLSPGLANRISAKFSKQVATAFPECANALGEKGVYAGLPIRASLFEGDRQKGLALAGFAGKKPVLLVMGGSQGAKAVNEALRAALPQVLPRMNVLHLCGKGHLDEALADTPGYYQTEFLSDELPHALAAADYILSRAGATAICEFLALKKPMLLIPLPLGSSRGDQIENAKSLAARGLAQVLPQEQMTPENLSQALTQLMENADELKKALEDAPQADGSEAIFNMIQNMTN
jgi:UDP-N-acetylglucosamine--N-acetylmuramyl-(pentapeptide) pyrophosphoryl-undecaprenol N-acetylglucosamine transferase